MHGLLGGAFKCNVDMHEFHKDHPEYTTGLLTFVIEYLTTKFWPNNAFMPPGSNTCDTECVSGQDPCGCTCSVDAMALSEDEVCADTYFVVVCLGFFFFSRNMRKIVFVCPRNIVFFLPWSKYSSPEHIFFSLFFFLSIGCATSPENLLFVPGGSCSRMFVCIFFGCDTRHFLRASPERIPSLPFLPLLSIFFPRQDILPDVNVPEPGYPKILRTRLYLVR